MRQVQSCPVRRSLTLILAGLSACKPPIDINTPPGLTVDSPAENAVVNQDTQIEAVVRVFDRDSEGPITITATSDLDGEVGRITDVAAEATVTLPLAPLSPGSHLLTITADDGEKDGITEKTVQFRVNGAPSLPVVSITPAAPTGADAITATLATEAIDPENQGIWYTWVWTEAAGRTFTGHQFPAIVPAEATERGQRWTLTVDAAEGQDQARPGGIVVSASWAIDVGNRAPGAPTALRVTPSNPDPSQPVRCDVSGAAVDPDGDPITYRFVWQRYTGAAWEDRASTPDLVPSFTAAGERWRCVVTAHDGDAEGPSATREVTFGDASRDVAEASWYIDGAGLGAAATCADLDGGQAELISGAPIDETYGTDAGIVAGFRATSLAGGARPTLATRAFTIAGTPGSAIGDALAPAPDGVAIAWSRGAVWVPAGAISTPVADPFAANFPGNRLTLASVEGRYAVATADLDGDGASEVLVAEEGGAVLGFDVGAPGALDASNARFDLRVAALALTAGGDGTGDGVGDFAVAGADRVWWFDGASAAGVRGAGDALAEIGLAADAMAIGGDLDGDGLSELWVAAGGIVYAFAGADLIGAVSADAAILQIVGDAAFGAHLTALPDADGDGLGELAIGDGDTVFVWPSADLTLALGHQLFAAEASVRIEGAALAPLDACDLDGDGRYDLLLGSTVSGRIWGFESDR